MTVGIQFFFKPAFISFFAGVSPGKARIRRREKPVNTRLYRKSRAIIHYEEAFNMEARKSLVALLAVTALSAAGAAHAGPKVTVTFKNQGTADATYKIVSANETNTYSNAVPKPQTTIESGKSSV